MQKRIRIYRVTLDTNIFVRSLITPKGINAKVVDFWRQDKYVLVLSKEIVEEIIEVLLRPELINCYPYTEADVLSLVGVISRQAIIIAPQISFDYCRDSEDNKFIICAIIGRVQYLVSGVSVIFLTNWRKVSVNPKRCSTSGGSSSADEKEIAL